MATNEAFAQVMKSKSKAAKTMGRKVHLIESVMAEAKKAETFACLAEKERKEPASRSVTAPGGTAAAQGNRFSLKASKVKGASEVHIAVRSRSETESAVGNPTVSGMSAVDGDSGTGGDSTADNVQVSEGKEDGAEGNARPDENESLGEQLARAMPLLEEAVIAGEQGLPHRILQAAVAARQAGVGVGGFPEAIIAAALAVEEDGVAVEGGDAEMSVDGDSEEGSEESEVSYGPTRRLNGKRVCGSHNPHEEEREGGNAEADISLRTAEEEEERSEEAVGSSSEEEESEMSLEGGENSSESGEELYPAPCKQYSG